MKKVVLCLIALILTFSALVLTSCDNKSTVEGFAIGTFYSITASKAMNASEVQALLDSIEERFSVNVLDSDIYRINNSVPDQFVEVSAETIALLEDSFAYSATQGAENAFNPAIFPLVALWGFAPPFLEYEDKAPPSQAQIDAVLPYCDVLQFVIEGNRVKRLSAHAALDLGGIAKGYAADKVKEYLVSKGVGSALINIGGTLLSYGKKSSIGITPPRDSLFSYIASFSLDNGYACATSGDYERYYFFEDIRYSHIIGKDGRPAQSDLIAVTVICASAKEADALSTLLFVEGEENAVNIIRAKGVKAILVTKNMEIVAVDIAVKLKDSQYSLRSA